MFFELIYIVIRNAPTILWKQSVTVLLIKGIIWKFWRVSCLSAGNQELFTTHSIRVFRHRLPGDSQNAMIASPIEHVCLIKQETVCSSNSISCRKHFTSFTSFEFHYNFLVQMKWMQMPSITNNYELKTQTKTIWVAIYTYV